MAASPLQPPGLIKRSRTSYMVNKIPSISSVGDLTAFCTIFMVFSNLPRPSNAKYSHCTGMITELAAVKGVDGNQGPNDGEQSMMIKSYSSFTHIQPLPVSS